jgi:hypothetical protein
MMHPIVQKNLDPNGMTTVWVSTNYRSGEVAQYAKKDRLGGRRNDDEFIVKLQRPHSVGSIREWICYDESRRLQIMLEPSIPGMQKALKLMMRNTANGCKGFKAYFYARREGRNLRILIDKLAPHQKW